MAIFPRPESVYKLVSRISVRFMLRFGLRRMPSPDFLDMLADQQPTQMAIMDVGVVEVGGSAATDRALPESAVRDGEPEDFARKNAKARVKHFTYTETDPQPSMQRMRIMIEPLRLLYSHADS